MYKLNEKDTKIILDRTFERIILPSVKFYFF